MRFSLDSDMSSSLTLELYQPKPNLLYSLYAAAQLAGVSRRSILIYCRAGFVKPVLHPPYGVMEFTEEAIYTVRRIEELRTAYGVDLTWLKAMCDLRNEVDRLRAEIRFLQNR